MQCASPILLLQMNATDISHISLLEVSFFVGEKLRLTVIEMPCPAFKYSTYVYMQVLWIHISPSFFNKCCSFCWYVSRSSCYQV